MPRDLFATGERQTAVRSRRSSLVLASIAVHVVAVVTILLLSILVPDVLPRPHAAGIEWDPTTRVVKLADIPLPPPPPSKQPLVAPRAPSSGDAVPLEAPDGVAPEDPSRRPDEPAPGFVDGSATGIDLTAMVPPPPPPPVAPSPTGPVRIHAGIDPPQKTRDVAPEYPVLARSTGAHGIVIIEATIDALGNVVETRVLRSIPVLDTAALDAVRQWKYAPARLNGAPVAVLVTVTVNFVLGR